MRRSGISAGVVRVVVRLGYGGISKASGRAPFYGTASYRTRVNPEQSRQATGPFICGDVEIRALIHRLSTRSLLEG